MKLTANLFSNLVGTEVKPLVFRSDIGFRAGEIVRIPEGVFRVEAKVFTQGDAQFRLASVGGSTVLSKKASELNPISPLEHRIASFVRLAFNKDFDEYVKDSIRSHGYPVDEDMNWSKWFEHKTRHTFAYAGEELRDEAVHNLIIWALIENDKLGGFNPASLNERVQALPLEKQITSYLQRVFDDRMDYIRSYISKSTGNGVEFSGENPDDETSGTLEQAADYETPHDLHEQAQEEGVFKKFRSSFFEWLAEDSKFQKRSIEPMKILFDLIILAEKPKPRYIEETFAQLSGASVSSLRGYIEKLAKALVEFSEVAPEGLVTMPLVRKLQAPSKASSLKKASQQDNKESQMSLKAKISALKAKYGKEEKKPIDKWAKLRRIAEEEPEEMGSALGELAIAFAELAEAADALAENLEVVEPEATENDDFEAKEDKGDSGEKAAKKKASKKKFVFASSFKRLAMENPGSLADALSEVYGTLDTVAEGIENLADNLGIDLAPADGMGMGDDMGMGMGDDMGMGGDMSTPPPAAPEAPAAEPSDEELAAGAPLNLTSRRKRPTARR